MSDSFFTSSGVRQGCILAPALFCRAIDWILERTVQVAGIQVGDHLYILMAEETDSLRASLEQFHSSMRMLENLVCIYHGK